MASTGLAALSAAPGARSEACTRKELRGSFHPNQSRPPVHPCLGAGGLGNPSLPPRGCPRRKSARRGRSSPSGWGGAGGGGQSGSAEGPGGNPQPPPRPEPRSGGRRGPPVLPEDPASRPFPGAAAAFSARSPWILRFRWAPARARKSSDRLHPSPLSPRQSQGHRGRSSAGARSGPGDAGTIAVGAGATGAQWLPAPGKTHRSDREEQTWSSQPRASER